MARRCLSRLSLALMAFASACAARGAVPSGAPRVAAAARPVVAAAAPAKAAAPRPWTSPFLWRVEGPTTTYLMGTMHLPDARVAKLPPEVEDALARSSAVVTELKLDFGLLWKMMGQGLLPPPHTLDEALPPPLVARIDTMLRRYGVAWAQVRGFKLILLTLMLEGFVHPPMEAGASILDMAVQTYAQRHAKRSLALETVDEQMSIYDDLTADEQAQVVQDLLESIENGSMRRAQDQVRECYFSGDEQRALALIKEHDQSSTSPATKKIDERMFKQRNARMELRIVAQREDGKTRLYAVGLAHLLGEDGLVARLRRRGLTVSRLGPPPTP
jgi:uncharacterized protein YbaP (TraB family)